MSTPAAQAVEHARLAADSDRSQIKKRAAAQIFHQRNAALARERDQFRRGCLLGESRDLEIRTMHAQQQPRAFGDGLFVVGDAGAVGRAHLAQDCARLRHHVGNAERAADLHQFAARDDDFSAVGQRVQRQQDRSGVVVHDDGRDCSCRDSPSAPRSAVSRASVGGLHCRRSAVCETADPRAHRACRARPHRGQTPDWNNSRQSRGCVRAPPQLSGARPRLVCRITPVALITGRRE